MGNVASMTENQSTSGWGTSFIGDGDINSAFRGTSTVIGTTTILFTFGSAVYMDSIVCVTNLTSTGTLVLRAGPSNLVSAQAFGIPIDGLGTSYKFFGNNGYQYWRLDLHGATALGQHQCNEIFLGKRLTISEMPSYPFVTGVEENTIELVSERGNKWVYQNYDREYWVMNFEGVGAVTENALHKMYKYCRKNTQPLWMNLDEENNPLDIKFVRFRDGAFLSSEETKNVFDLTMELEKEI